MPAFPCQHYNRQSSPAQSSSHLHQAVRHLRPRHGAHLPLAAGRGGRWNSAGRNVRCQDHLPAARASGRAAAKSRKGGKASKGAAGDSEARAIVTGMEGLEHLLSVPAERLSALQPRSGHAASACPAPAPPPPDAQLVVAEVADLGQVPRLHHQVRLQKPSSSRGQQEQEERMPVSVHAATTVCAAAAMPRSGSCCHTREELPAASSCSSDHLSTQTPRTSATSQ